MMFGLGGSFSYDICGRCGCMQIRDIPEDLARYYPSEYYSFQFNPHSRKNRIERIHNLAVAGQGSRLGNLLNTVFNNRPLEAFSRLDMPKSARILDVGCGSGTLLYFLREQGYEHTQGVDPFLDQDIVYDHGLKITKGALNEVDDVFDLVMMHQAFEHVPDPLQTLRELADRLCDGGLCMLRIPWVECDAFEQYGINWVALDAPRHLYVYSLESMRFMAEQLGMTIETHYTDSTSMQFWASEQYEQGIPLFDDRSMARNKVKKITQFPRRLQLEKKSDALNKEGRGDNVVFVLRKGGS